jgi:hypothetical protein
LLRLSLLELGQALALPIAPSVTDTADFEPQLSVPMWRLRSRFSSETAFRSFVARKLDQAEERASVLRIAAIFDAPSNSGVTECQTLL